MIFEIFTFVNMTNVIFTTWSSAVCIQRIKGRFINTSYQDRNLCMCTGAVGALRCDFQTKSITDTVLGYPDIISQKCETEVCYRCLDSAVVLPGSVFKVNVADRRAEIGHCRTSSAT